MLRERELSSKMPGNWDGKDWTARYKELGIELSSLQSGEVT